MAASGRTLAGRYRLKEVIGRGGMSTVYRARDEVLARTVAIKILLPALADQDPTYAVRFEREARAAAGLDSSAVVTVYDTGVDADSHYIVMEYIEGRSLDEMLLAGRPLAIAEAIRIASRVAAALASAHEAGILHRDIKPANVMVAFDGAVKVLDFGIARRLDGTSITQAASVVGTAAYMAPERALGEPGDARADIYSLGCLLYAMLTGRPPFTGEISAALLHQQINTPPRPPGELRAGLPPTLEALILTMLAKSPDARPASAAEVRDELRRLADEPTLPVRGAGPITAATIPMRAGLPPRARLLADHRRRAVLMALVTGAVALIAVALLSAGGSAHHPATRSRPVAGTSRTTPAVRTTSPAPKPPKPKPAQPNPAQPAPGTPPGHGGTPPGQAKKHKH